MTDYAVITDPSKLRKEHDEVLLLVTFGSTHEEPHQTFAKIRQTFREAFPDTDIYMAFTSRICMKRWAEKTGQQYYAPDEWLKAIGQAGYKRVLIQSLHVIPGLEYSFITQKYIPAFQQKHPGVQIILGEPLLWNDKDVVRVGNALFNIFRNRLEQGEALVLMGHGNNTDAYPDANNKYIQLNQYLQTLNPRIVIGTVDFESMLFDFVVKSLERTCEKGCVINLSPLMSVAGDHAKNDMAGAYDAKESMEEQSWRVQLDAMGYRIDPETNCHLKGLADFPEIRAIWVNHLKEKINPIV